MLGCVCDSPPIEVPVRAPVADRVRSPAKVPAGQPGADLAGRCRTCLEERLRCMELATSQLVVAGTRTPAMWVRAPVASHVWFMGSGWEVRATSLYTLAGEVARRLGK